MKKIYEFLLWNNCGNNCTFCHQRAHERRIDDNILTPDEQIRSLLLCREFLDTTFENGNHILLVGGEIFDIQNEQVKKVLIDLIIHIKEKMCKNEIELLYVNTNLLYENTDLLDWFLSLYETNGLIKRIKFTTSYDMVGRFTSKARELLFYKNLKRLTDTYTDIKIVVNTVLTKEACKRICEDKFGADYLLEYLQNQGKNEHTIKQWIDYFKVKINTIPYIILDYDKAPSAPTKKEVFETLLHIDAIIPGYLQEYSDNIGLKQEKLLFEYNKINNSFVFCSSKMGNCGHSVNFQQSFGDSKECFPCQIAILAKYSNK